MEFHSPRRDILSRNAIYNRQLGILQHIIQFDVLQFTLSHFSVNVHATYIRLSRVSTQRGPRVYFDGIKTEKKQWLLLDTYQFAVVTVCFSRRRIGVPGSLEGGQHKLHGRAFEQRS